MSRLDATSETIVAVATAPGPAARGVVRISGPGAWGAVAALLAEPDPIPNHNATVRNSDLRVPGIQRPVRAQLLVWTGNTGFTGQPAIEIHTWGNPPLLQALVQALCARGARLARPGEFALRAFLAGKLDLLQAEAIVGLIDASDRSEFTLALTQLAGGMAGPLDQIRNELIDALALLEAGLDFVEDDIEFVSEEELRQRLTVVANRIADLQQQIRARSSEETLPIVTLVGRPNAGKSSLFNALVQREAAIVAPVAGTTRDYLRAVLTVGRWRVQLIDTAGLDPDTAEASLSEMERLAAEKTIGQAGRATVQVICIDATSLAESPPGRWSGWTLPTGVEPLWIVTKCDQVPGERIPDRYLPTSSWTGEGLRDLQQAIADRIGARWGGARDVIPATATRCAAALALVAEAIQAALDSLQTGASGEFVASDLRVALEHLGTIVGAIYNDDILDRVFSRFCIGK